MAAIFETFQQQISSWDLNFPRSWPLWRHMTLGYKKIFKKPPSEKWKREETAVTEISTSSNIFWKCSECNHTRTEKDLPPSSLFLSSQ